MQFNRRDGFTLLEMLIVIAVIGILIIPLSSSLSSGFKFFKIGQNRSELQGEVRFIATYITKVIRNADEIELHANLPTVTGDYKCIGIDGSQVKYCTATDTKILATNIISDLYYKIDADGSFTTEDDENNDVLIVNIVGEEGTNEYTLETNILLNNIYDKPTIDSSNDYNFIKFK